MRNLCTFYDNRDTHSKCIRYITKAYPALSADYYFMRASAFLAFNYLTVYINEYVAPYCTYIHIPLSIRSTTYQNMDEIRTTTMDYYPARTKAFVTSIGTIIVDIRLVHAARTNRYVIFFAYVYFGSFYFAI